MLDKSVSASATLCYRRVSPLDRSPQPRRHRLHLLSRPRPRRKGCAAEARGSNTKIKVVASPEVVQKILEHVALHYFDNYAMIAFIDDVEVPRGDKFVATVLHEN